MKCRYILLNLILPVVLNCFFTFSFYLTTIIIYKRVAKKESICYAISDYMRYLGCLLFIFWVKKKTHVIWSCWLCDSYSWSVVSFKSHRDSLRLKIINCCLFQRKVVSELLIWMNLTEVDGSILVGFIFFFTVLRL